MPGVVTVACRMPNGLRLRIYDFIETYENVIGGGQRPFRKAVRRPKPDVVLKGFTVPYGVMPNQTVVGGYGLTHEVDADFFSEWMKQNAESDLVKNNIVIAHEKADVVVKRAKEHNDTKSGLEPLDPGTVFKGGVEEPVDVRWPRKIQKATKDPV
jgi:hypothetical protein